MPKKPQTAFEIYSKEASNNLKKQNPNLKKAEIQTILEVFSIY
jgi:hypothetical protein